MTAFQERQPTDYLIFTLRLPGFIACRQNGCRTIVNLCQFPCQKQSKSNKSHQKYTYLDGEIDREHNPRNFSFVKEDDNAL